MTVQRNYKAVILPLLERGPATTYAVREACGCRSAAQALSALKILRGYGIVEGRLVRRDRAVGPMTTTQWRLVPEAGQEAGK